MRCHARVTIVMILRDKPSGSTSITVRKMADGKSVLFSLDVVDRSLWFG